MPSDIALTIATLRDGGCPNRDLEWCCNPVDAAFGQSHPALIETVSTGDVDFWVVDENSDAGANCAFFSKDGTWLDAWNGSAWLR